MTNLIMNISLIQSKEFDRILHQQSLAQQKEYHKLNFASKYLLNI